ncbi:hypothetical protein M378DRAFT_381516 [Amanita muscaria Koide BX008]|uniref:Uncharacterized protein n=1 Tax=Amanita muscaria (strain Koide BX008) TaxID=946122 RepID=A0A0C2W8P4_AMAMK|nr:hypothetical protein M378DRAFT_381516 [Amanita muscaria Koide BX008]
MFAVRASCQLTNIFGFGDLTPGWVLSDFCGMKVVEGLRTIGLFPVSFRPINFNRCSQIWIGDNKPNLVRVSMCVRAGICHWWKPNPNLDRYSHYQQPKPKQLMLNSDMLEFYHIFLLQVISKYS